MLRKLQARLTYANVTATVALFLALGGGAYAAIDLVGRNDIKSRHIAPNQVRAADTSDRLRLECPGGTRYHEGACIETGFRSDADYEDAESDCFDEGGRRLPNTAELQSFRREPGIALADDGEWTSEAHFDDSSFRARLMRDGSPGLVAFADLSATNNYRCVARPKR